MSNLSSALSGAPLSLSSDENPSTDKLRVTPALSIKPSTQEIAAINEVADAERSNAVWRVRVGALVLLAIQFINIAADFYAKRGFATRFSLFHLLNVAALAALISLTWTRFFMRRWHLWAMIGCGALLAMGTLMSVLSGDVLPRFASVLIFSLGCATFLPWGGRYQAALNTMCLASFATDTWYVGNMPRESVYLWVGLFTALILSQLVAMDSERSRDALMTSAKELAVRDAAIDSARLKSRFLATMSHEIRTPLHLISTYASVIERQFSKSGLPRQLIAARDVRNAARRITQCIDRIVDLSRLEEGTFQVCPVPLNVAALVTEVVEEFRPLAEEKGIRLSWEPAMSVPSVVFDEYCLAGAVRNLIENALNFTRHGAITVRLLEEADGKIALEIQDTGVGIDPPFIPKLFEPFSQEQQEYSRTFKGAGLGLALVKQYLALNHADISVSSVKGQGTSFQIRLTPQVSEV